MIFARLLVECSNIIRMGEFAIVSRGCPSSNATSISICCLSCVLSQRVSRFTPADSGRKQKSTVSS